MNICVYGASSNDIDRSYIEETENKGVFTTLETILYFFPHSIQIRCELPVDSCG